MSELVIDADFFNQDRFIEQEKLVVSKMVEIMLFGTFSEEQIYGLNKAINEYYYLLCCGSYIKTADIKNESLLRVLDFLIKYPVANKIDVCIMEPFYGEGGLFDMTTYGAFQITSEGAKESDINRFMSHVKGSSIEKICAFFLFRLNPEYVKKHYQYDNVYEMTETELYYSISTGYFKIKHGTNVALKRLVEMSAQEKIDKLIKEGFWIIT